MIDVVIFATLLALIISQLYFARHYLTSRLPMGPVIRILRILGIESGYALIASSLLLTAIALIFAIQELFGFGIGGALVSSAGLLSGLVFLLLFLAGQRVRKLESALPEAIELIRATSRSGGTAQSALTAVAQTSEGLLGKEFRWMVQALQHGASIEQATQRLDRLYGTPVVKLFVQSLVTKWQVGGNLAELMDSVQRLIRTRLKLKLQAQGRLSGARFSGLFVGVLPYTLVPFFLVRDPAWFEILLTDPRGPTLLVSAFFLQILALCWLLRVLRVQL